MFFGMSIGEDLASGSVPALPGLNLTDFLGLAPPPGAGLAVEGVDAEDDEVVLRIKSSVSPSFRSCLFSL